MDKQLLMEQLIEFEGLKLYPYKCTADKLTIGIGRNLDDVGITESEAKFLLLNDIARVEKKAQSYSWYAKLNPVRQRIICDMIFNLGNRFDQFKKMKAGLETNNIDVVCKEMQNSKWYSDVGRRAVYLIELMRTGSDIAT
jgi:lysozyme